MPDETTTNLARKLRLTATTRLLALNAPADYLAALRQPGLLAALDTAPRPGATYDAAHLFVRERAQLQAALPAVAAALARGGALWVMWPKQSARVATDLTRDSLAALALAQGWGPVSNVAVDATWSALRLRPEAEVKRAGSARPPAAR